jgi:hypothetical protein
MPSCRKCKHQPGRNGARAHNRRCLCGLCVLLKDWHEQEKARPHYRAFSLLSMNPGLAYVAGAWQVAAEVIVPINNEGGRTIGMRAHLFLFLDDLFPACSENHF